MKPLFNAAALIASLIGSLGPHSGGRVFKQPKPWQVAEEQRARMNRRAAFEINAKRKPSRQERRRKEIQLARRFGFQKGVCWQEARRMLRARAAKQRSA